MHEAILLVRTITEMVISVAWSTMGACDLKCALASLARIKAAGLGIVAAAACIPEVIPVGAINRAKPILLSRIVISSISRNAKGA